MESPKPLVSIICPEHKSQLFGAIDTGCTAKKLVYCYQCIIQSNVKGILPKTLKTFADYLNETSGFYKKCRQRAHITDEPPTEYTNELSKKAERLEMLSKHIDEEKQNAKDKFANMRKNLELKEKKCLQLLEEEISGLSEAYTQYEKLLKTEWPNLADLEALYPIDDVLEQKLSKIVSVDQLQAFVKAVMEDIETEKEYGDQENGLEKRKQRIKYLKDCFQKVESSLPRLQDVGNLELFKELIPQKIRIQHSVLVRMKGPPCESKIINEKQYEDLQSFLPNSNNSNFKLLYRGSSDGRSAQMCHKKCDGKGATVTLIKCRFRRACSSSIIGGFTDQSWNSNQKNTSLNQAFLFAFPSGTNSIECPLLEHHQATAFHGFSDFGVGGDLMIHIDLKTGSISSKCYYDAALLYWNNESTFDFEEIEVYQV